MKKVLLLLTIMVTLCTYGWAQLGVGQQMQNNNFEQWTTEPAPQYWHSIKDPSGSQSLIGMASSGTFVEQSSGAPGGTGNKVVRLIAVDKSVLFVTITANGSLSTGRFNVGDASASNTKNCTYTSTNSGYNQVMTAYPDSVYVWTKTSFGAGNEASFNIVIHNNTVSSGASHNAVFQDPAPSNANNSVVGTNATVNNAKIVAKAYKTFYTSNQWVQQKVAFTYPNNNTTPSYILATFSTNKNPGGGSAGHSLYFDDVVLIYNTRLATLKVNGSDLAGFNPDVTSYNYPTPISCSGSAPSVTGTCQSAHASTQIMHNATPAEPYTTIRVKHLNQESTVYKDYTIHFTYQGSTITLNNGGNYTVCQGQPLTMTASGANSYSWSNGLGNSASVSAPTGTAGTTDYTVTGTDASGCTATATATVTVNPLPAVTLTPSATSACTPNTITLTAGGNATSYSWSGVTGSGTSVTLSAANTYNVTVTGTISSTGCSNTASTSVTITQAPTVTISGEASACSQGELTASGATTYSWSNDMGTGATIHPTATGTYTVTGTTNGCSATAQQQFTLRPTPEVSISGGSQFCEGSTLSLTA